MNKNLEFGISAFLIGATASAAPLAVFEGPVTDKTPGWTFQSSISKNGMTYNKFEGYYPDKGGKLFSARIPLKKPDGEPAYYRITFDAKAPERAYQGINFYDKADNLLPDLYDVLYAGERRSYDRVFYAMGKVSSVEIFFQSKKGCEVSNIRLEPASVKDAADYCDRVYQQLSPVKFSAPADAMKLLPKTAEALKTGKPWRVVLLGDSIMQDTFHSQFHSLVKREFPKSNFSWIISMRGSTGCWHYCKTENFKKYVTEERPDLLVIGGYSNYRMNENPTGHEAMGIVAKRAQIELGCEILFMTGALALDTRKHDPDNLSSDIPAYKWVYEQDKYSQSSTNLRGLTETARQCGSPVWNMLFPCYEWLYASGKPFEFYSRDKVHSGELGKQVIGRIALEYFKTAASCAGSKDTDK